MPPLALRGDESNQIRAFKVASRCQKTRVSVSVVGKRSTLQSEGSHNEVMYRDWSSTDEAEVLSTSSTEMNHGICLDKTEER